MTTEKRLIDADAVRHDINVHMARVIYRGIGFIPSGKDSNSAYEFLRGYEEGSNYIANLVLQEKYLMDAVDIVEVVRCKDCKHWWKENETCKHPKCCEAWMCVMQAPKEHFCSYGERKDNESNSGNR